VLSGELDGSRARLFQAVVAVMDAAPGTTITIDATAVTFLDSDGLRALLIWHPSVSRGGEKRLRWLAVAAGVYGRRERIQTRARRSDRRALAAGHSARCIT
jgi:anti-anti-sigma factor